MPRRARKARAVFVADDLGGWLIGLVADAARKKLIRGDELDRALRASAATAIKRTGAELSPTNLSKRQQSSTRCFTARPEPCQSGKRLRDLSVSGWAAQDLLEVGHSPLEQQDRLVQPPGRLVGGSQVAPRAEGLGGCRPGPPRSRRPLPWPYSMACAKLSRSAFRHQTAHRRNHIGLRLARCPCPPGRARDARARQ